MKRNGLLTTRSTDFRVPHMLYPIEVDLRIRTIELRSVDFSAR